MRRPGQSTVQSQCGPHLWLHARMHLMEIFHLADHASGAVLDVVAFNGGCIGVTVVHGQRRRGRHAGGLGMLYATLGQQEQARTELPTAIAMSQAMAMTCWRPAAEAALAQVERR